MESITDNHNAGLTDGMHLMVDALKVNGIKTIYGVVGIPVTDLARHAQAVGIRYIGFRHEQSAGHAAAITGYLTKKPGICLTVSALCSCSSNSASKSSSVSPGKPAIISQAIKGLTLA